MLIDQLAGPEGDLLGLHRILTGAPPAWAGLPSFARLWMELSQPELLRKRLEHFRRQGYLSMVVMGEPRLFEMLGRKGSDALPAPLPIVPNLQGFMREAVEHGMLGAGLRRAWRVGPMALTSLGMRSMGRLGALVRRDFPTMLRSFIELELADFAGYHPPVIFLQAQMTDLAVALHNPRILTAFFEAVENRTGAVAGLATYNFAPLMAMLKSWGLEAAAILTPWDSQGAHMRPDLESCIQAAKAAQIPIWADRGGRPEPPRPEDRTAMERAGLAGAVRDDISLWGGSA